MYPLRARQTVTYPVRTRCPIGGGEGGASDTIVAASRPAEGAVRGREAVAAPALVGDAALGRCRRLRRGPQAPLTSVTRQSSSRRRRRQFAPLLGG